MSSVAAPADRRPRIFAAPAYSSSSGDEAIELAEMAGIFLDPWQQHVLRVSLGENHAGDWAAPEVGLVCPRQNGKNEILVARELAGLFLLGERLIVHSAHQADTSMEAWRRLRFVIENTPDLARRVRSYPGTHGQEGIELRNGQRIRFRTRTKGGGRGFSGDLVVFDEAMEFPQASLAAILPIVSARPNPQVWYTGSAVDQLVHTEGLVLARVRKRGVAGDDPRLAYFEWSADADTPGDLTAAQLADPRLWELANPALDVRITRDYVAGELVALGPRAFAVERLGVGDWPDPDQTVNAVIDPDRWDACFDDGAKLQDPVVLAFDVTPDRSSGAVGAAGVDQLGRPMVEVAESDRGAGWIVPWIVDRGLAHKPVAVVCDGTGAAASLIPELEHAGVQVTTMTAQEHAQACGVFYDLVDQEAVRHRGQQELDAALRGASKRPLGGGWAWNRKTSATNLAPLVAVTLALGRSRLQSFEKPKPAPRIINLNDLDD